MSFESASDNQNSQPYSDKKRIYQNHLTNPATSPTVGGVPDTLVSYTKWLYKTLAESRRCASQKTTSTLHYNTPEAVEMLYQNQLILVVLLTVGAWGKNVHDVQTLLGRKLNIASASAGASVQPFFSTDVAEDKYTPPEEKDPQFWYDLAYEEIAKRLALDQPNAKKAKNIILFLGDGMSLTTVAAARILKGQRQGNTGEESALSFETFPHTGLSRVSNRD